MENRSIMTFDLLEEGGWLMYCRKSNNIYFEKNETAYKQALDIGMVDVSFDLYWINRYDNQLEIEKLRKENKS